jgi:hypothetical protein
MVPVRPGEYIDYEDQWYWADADVGHAAHYMRKIVADGRFRARIARQARRDIAARFSDAATVSAIRKRLAELDILRPWVEANLAGSTP